MVNLFYARLSLRSWGREASDENREAGSTRVDSEAKLLAERFRERRVGRKVRSEGRVQRLFWARLRTWRLGRLAS